MPFVRANIDTRYREYADLRLRLHNLLSATMPDDAACEQVEDELIAKWDGLDEAQRISLHGMGADLSWILDRGAPPPRGRSRKDVTEDDWADLAAALRRQDWQALLYSLRVCAPVLSISTLAHCRAQSYSAIGFPLHAQVFSRFAREIAIERARKQGFKDEALSYLPESVFAVVYDWKRDEESSPQLTGETPLPDWRPSSFQGLGFAGAC